MSPSDHRTASRGAARVATGSAPSGRNGGRTPAPVDDDPATGPIDLPEIVPATSDDPEPSGTEIERDATDGWVDSGPPPVVVSTPTGVSAPLRVRGRRPRVRKVTRTVRHIDPWSTFKVALIFSLVLYGVVLTSGVLLWNVAATTGTISNIERWFTQFGWESFELNGGEIFSNAWVAGLFGAVALTGFAVLVVTLFNLVSDMVGGMRVTVLEEEVVERTTSQSRRYVVRRPPTGAVPATPGPTATTATTGPDPSPDPGADATAPGGSWSTTPSRSTVRTARRVDAN